MPTKTELTRERITSVALELFLERGFDETTVAQIAAASEVSEMTFFRYFRSKEAVVIDDPYDPYIAGAIASQPRELPTIARAAGGILSAWQKLPEPEGVRTRQRIRIAASTPSLQGGMWSNNVATERAITSQLVADGANELEAKIAAAACLAGLIAALYDWGLSDDGRLGARVETALLVLGARQ